MKIVVIEPHPDDAFLSLGWHLERVWEEYERTIITVYANSRRTTEAEAYASAIGASSVVLGLAESNMGSSGPIRPIPSLKAMLEGLNLTSEDLTVFPLGLQHPDHLRVAATRTPGAIRYLDTPYQTKLKLADDLSRRAEGMTIHSIVFPPQRKWKHVPVFKSQSKFFHFNADLKTAKIPEVILCPS